MDIVRNEKVRRRAGIKRKSVSTTDQRVFRWFGHVGEIRCWRSAVMLTSC